MTLQPCPHCGKTETDKDELTKETAVIASRWSAGKACVAQCNHCGLSGPIEDTVPLAITAWNSLPRKAVTADDIIADLESRGLGWSIDHIAGVLETCVWDRDNVIALYRPAKVEPLAKMLATACFDVDWTKYPILT